MSVRCLYAKTATQLPALKAIFVSKAAWFSETCSPLASVQECLFSEIIGMLKWSFCHLPKEGPSKEQKHVSECVVSSLRIALVNLLAIRLEIRRVTTQLCNAELRSMNQKS